MSVCVGIVGLSASGGWAARAHLPALRALPDEYEVRGLVASTPIAGRAAASAHGIPRVFESAAELIEDDEIDLVVVAVKVTEHRELVLRALAAGKSVVCEWPLGVDLAEAQELAEAARVARVRTLIGLQARSSPVLARLRDVVAAGVIGEVLSTSVQGGGGNWAGTVASRSEYQLDRANGATLITIPLAHTLDAVSTVLGPLTELSATTAVRRRSAVNQETGAVLASTAEDVVAVDGVLASGAVVSVHLRGGLPAEDGFVWQIHGSDGVLTVTQDWAHPQFGELVVSGLDGLGKPTGLGKLDGDGDRTPGPAENVRLAYRQFAVDLRDGGSRAPGFDDAVRHHVLVDAVHQAASTGRRQHLAAAGAV